MGKGDKRTKRGKIHIGSTGVVRQKRKKLQKKQQLKQHLQKQQLKKQLLKKQLKKLNKN